MFAMQLLCCRPSYLSCRHLDRPGWRNQQTIRPAETLRENGNSIGSLALTLLRYFREALEHIPPERLIISSDCGMGREGMGRRHATYKMVAMVLGTNIVRKELGLPQADCLAAEQRYSLTATKSV